ncbi:MAG TPA: hypothetical protein ENN23_01400 [Deltaproteobacteria bacterium]|nr:hypothetical protein [Deltaproteobacteria bacterium]
MELANSALSIIKSIRIQDVMDIAIIAVMIFAFFTWFKNRASRFVLIGIILLGGIYIAARFFQLYLTTIVLQAFFAIVLFVLVVIFQEDLRNFFERLAMLGNLRKKARPLSELEKASEIITQTAVTLAKKGIGALIVLQDNDHLDRHLHGGTKLDGLISEPVLESIFDPNSDGHDGAVIIKGDRIKMFGCHLPLSINTARYGNIGLRHSAAIGLAQRSDALCIVVSEETSAISIAYQNNLTRVSNAAALHKELEQFFMRNVTAKKTHPAIAWLKENKKEKVIALILASTLWIAFGYQREIVRRNFIIPIEYRNVPQYWRIDEPRLTEAKVILQGPQQAFYLLDERSLKLSLDLASISDTKQEIVLSKEMVNAPSNLSITEIKPATIHIYATNLVSGTLPVTIVTMNSLPDNISLQKMTISPPEVAVLYDSRMNPDSIKLKTEPIDLQKINLTTTIDTRVVLPDGVYFPEGKAPTTRVIVRVKKRST